MNRTLRTIIVILVSVLAIGQAAPDLSRPFGHPLGQYGFALDGKIVTLVNRGGPADRAGLRAGDRISLRGNSVLAKVAAAQDFSAAPGDRLNVAVLLPRRRHVVITSVAESAQNYPYLVLRQTFYILTILVAAVLLILRPGKATWALFLYALGAINAANAVVSDWFHDSLLFNVFLSVLNSIPIFALVWFGVCIGGQRAKPVDRVILVASAAPAVVNFATTLAVFIGDWTYAQDAVVGSTVEIVAYALAICAILGAYRRASEQHRAALQWIVAAILVSGMAMTADTLLYLTYLPYPLHAVFNTSPVFIFAAAAYALLANRIIDVHFVASRALVYAILTSITVGVLALIDWFVTKQLDAVRLGFILEVSAALALGVTIQRLHHWSDAVVDKYVFRAAHEAELRLKRLGRALVHAPSREVIDRAVCEDAAQTLSLASAAIFRRADDNQYARSASFNWPAPALGSVDAGHRLALYLCAEERPIVPDAFSADDVLPDGIARPALAIPFMVRHQLIGFVLYGSHTNGAHPDSKDVELLTDLTARATAAYDHVAMEERTNENHELRTQNILLRSLLGEAKA